VSGAGKGGQRLTPLQGRRKEEKTETDSRQSIDRRTLIAYGSFGFPIAILGYPMTLFLHPYYAGELGLGLAAISTVLLLSRLTDFVTDPIMGWVSDRTQSRFGRRRPYVLLGLPVMLIGIYKLFLPEPPVDIWYMLIWNMVVYLGWTIMILPYGAWGAELSDDYMDRARITASRQVWTIGGLLGASVVIWFFQEILDSPGSGQVLAGIGMTLLILFPIVVTVLLFLVPEREVDVPPRRQMWWKELTSMMKIGPFRRMVYVALAIVIGEASRHAVVVFFMNDVLQAGDRIGRTFIFYYLMGVAAIPLWQWLAKKYGKHRSLAIAMTWSGLMVLATAFLGAGDYNTFLIFFVLKGASFGAFAYLPLAIVADVVDVDTAVTRQKRAGIFFAVFGAVDKIGIAIGMFIALQVLNLTGYDPGQSTNEAGLWMIRLEYAVIPTFFFLLASYIVWNYPVTNERHASLIAGLERRALREAS
jgi:Na+/melibiose symporter-like transporter